MESDFPVNDFQIKRPRLSGESNKFPRSGSEAAATSSTHTTGGDCAIGNGANAENLLPVRSSMQSQFVTSTMETPDLLLNDCTMSSQESAEEMQGEQSSIADWSVADSMAVNVDDASALNPDDNDDNLSEISNLSGISGQEWKFNSGPMGWIQKQMLDGCDPSVLLRDLMPKGTRLPPDIDDLTLWRIIVNLLSEPPARTKLTQVNTIDDVVQLIRSSRSIVVLTGAGVSVSCGIPDFRSRDGIYARLSIDFPDLPDPQAMFDIHYFRRDPRPFFKFAKEIYPGQFQPSACHRFIRRLEEHGQLLRNYTQNIDTLEQVAGITKVIQCHGSFNTATCMNCKRKVKADEIKPDVMNQTIPRCTTCPADAPHAIMKPDIVFFGEGLSDEFHATMAEDKNECDLLIVIGSSLKVRPVALIPSSISQEVPQVLINREPLPHINFDVELLGDGDIIVRELCQRLGDDWTGTDDDAPPPLTELTDLPVSPDDDAAAAPDDDRLESDAGATGAPPADAPMPPEERSDLQGAPSERSGDRLSCHDESSSMSVASQRTEMTSLSVDTDVGGGAPYVSGGAPYVGGGAPYVGGGGPYEVSMDTDGVGDAAEGGGGGKVATPSNCHRHNQHEIDELMSARTDTEELRKCFSPCRGQQRTSLAKKLPANAFLFIPPNRYVFEGAEVYADADPTTPSNLGVNRTDKADDSSAEGSLSDDDRPRGNQPLGGAAAAAVDPAGAAGDVSEPPPLFGSAMPVGDCGNPA
ncbi:PREDICTED: NAD-dependent protein deacetylase sirtuin-1-like [Priapulus caudatus]|uniref:NAD-dependent protein deacetylase sirtuin-1-like n=1 Tax=Priapulus caudatus TaxID=37621 RepID=A0ABM1EMZ5_PRICU|nr:PREDICTED: NAD-dependent protein deacetylase sirtuin-1-like [Priapulus caudatus]